MFLTLNCCFRLKHESIILQWKSHLVWIRREICTDQATVLNKYVGGFKCEDSRSWPFHWRKRCWTRILAGSNGLKLKTSTWRICLQTQLLSDLDVNCWTGVVWIIVMFLSAVWSLILTAPIHCRAFIGEEILQICSDEETNSSTSWVAWEGMHFNLWMKQFICKSRCYCIDRLFSSDFYADLVFLIPFILIPNHAMSNINPSGSHDQIPSRFRFRSQSLGSNGHFFRFLHSCVENNHLNRLCTVTSNPADSCGTTSCDNPQMKSASDSITLRSILHWKASSKLSPHWISQVFVWVWR